MLGAVAVPVLASHAVGDTPRLLGNRIAATVTLEGSTRQQIDLWQVAATIALDHPLVGTGPDTYLIVFPNHCDRVLPAVRAASFVPYRIESPDSVYLGIAASTGLIALTAYTIAPASAPSP